jgi:hypothetical protein
MCTEGTIGSDPPGSSHIYMADKPKGNGAAPTTGQQKYHTTILGIMQSSKSLTLPRGSHTQHSSCIDYISLGQDAIQYDVSLSFIHVCSFRGER